MISFSGRRTSNGDFPLRVLYSTLFFVYVLYPATLSYLHFGIPLLVARIAVQFMVIIIRFIFLIMILVSLYLLIVSVKTIPLFQSFSLRLSFLNSPPQSSCT
jgi:hypothetical protein